MLRILVYIVIIIFSFNNCLYASSLITNEKKEIDVSFKEEDLREIKKTKLYLEQNSFFLIKLSLKYLKLKEYKKALDLAKYAYVRAGDTHTKAKALFIIATIDEKMGFVGIARLKYRQIINNFKDNKEIVKQAKKRLIRMFN